eukprot:1633522-Rhodomonas_salina.1
MRRNDVFPLHFSCSSTTGRTSRGATKETCQKDGKGASLCVVGFCVVGSVLLGVCCWERVVCCRECGSPSVILLHEERDGAVGAGRRKLKGVDPRLDCRLFPPLDSTPPGRDTT